MYTPTCMHIIKYFTNISPNNPSPQYNENKHVFCFPDTMNFVWFFCCYLQHVDDRPIFSFRQSKYEYMDLSTSHTDPFELATPTPHPLV